MLTVLMVHVLLLLLVLRVIFPLSTWLALFLGTWLLWRVRWLVVLSRWWLVILRRRRRV